MPQPGNDANAAFLFNGTKQPIVKSVRLDGSANSVASKLMKCMVWHRFHKAPDSLRGVGKDRELSLQQRPEVSLGTGNVPHGHRLTANAPVCDCARAGGGRRGTRGSWAIYILGSAAYMVALPGGMVPGSCQARLSHTASAAAGRHACG